ncbi:MAG: GDP-mannose 4,6-dehydratase, partial [archaeon]|nr:GDP-mannose 4,6-dehydratase [archaeon]
SFDMPEYTANITGLGSLRILEAIRNLKSKARYYQASSSEMFGKVLETPQKPTTPFNPQSPYGASKVFSYFITKIYREAYDIFASNGILFNHESERRGMTFVTRKITRGLANVRLGRQKTLRLGNLDSKRDWGYAKDYVEGIWRILQHTEPDDFLIATGENHTVREFVEESGKALGMNIEWQGSGMEEKGVDTNTRKVVVEVDPVYFRPTEVETLLGDASKARAVLGWKPQTSFQELAKIMTEHDFAEVQREARNGENPQAKD